MVNLIRELSVKRLVVSEALIVERIKSIKNNVSSVFHVDG